MIATRRKRALRRMVPFLAFASLAVVAASAQIPPATPGTTGTEGTSPGEVKVPAFTLPFSAFASDAARDEQALRLKLVAMMRAMTARGGNAAAAPPPGPPARSADPMFERLIKTHAGYRVTIAEDRIGDIPVQVFTPAEGVSAKNRNRVLINLHGGGFVSGWDTWSRTESIPIASVGRIKVVSVNYRMAPQYKFPAASEDAASVYRALLKTHKPSQIGIYGCSGGGIIAGQTLALMQRQGLPTPAAAALFSSYTTAVQGDSVFISGRIGGLLPAPAGTVPPDSTDFAYMSNMKPHDPAIEPSYDPAVLAKFPPTLLITGTRAYDMSPAARTQIDLTKAGVDARLYLWDGVDHCFTYNAALRESQEAYAITAKFFDEMMDRAERGGRR